MGDLNSDIRKGAREIQPYGRLLKNILRRYELKNVIKQRTRTTKDSQTLIDIIITSDESKILKAGTFDTGIADHSLVYATVQLKMEKAPPKMQVVTNISKCDWKSFNVDLGAVPWTICEIFEDVDDSNSIGIN